MLNENFIFFLMINCVGGIIEIFGLLNKLLTCAPRRQKNKTKIMFKSKKNGLFDLI